MILETHFWSGVDNFSFPLDDLLIYDLVENIPALLTLKYTTVSSPNTPRRLHTASNCPPPELCNSPATFLNHCTVPTNPSNSTQHPPPSPKRSVLHPPTIHPHFPTPIRTPRMSRKVQTHALSAADEKMIATQLKDHIRNQGDGVYLKPSDPSAFPLVDAVLVAQQWKVNFPNKFIRYTKPHLESVIKDCYAKIASEFKAVATPALSTSLSGVTSPAPTLSAALSANNNTSQPAKKPLTVKEPKAVIKRQKSGFIDQSSQETVQLGNPTQIDSNSNASVIFGSPFDDAGVSKVSTGQNSLTPHQVIASNTITLDSDDEKGDGDDDDDVEIDLEREYNQNDSSMNDDTDTQSAISLIDDQTSKLSLTQTPSQSYFSAPTLQPTQSSTATPPASVNSSLNNIYNPNAVPYSQRPPPTPTPPQQAKPAKPLTRKQQEKQTLSAIYEDSKHNVPLGTRLRQVYKKHRDEGYSHPQAEALARKSLNMQYLPENLPNEDKDGRDKGGSKKGSKKESKEKGSGVVVPIRPTVTLKDVGGIDPIIQEIREIIEYPLTHPEIFSHLGVPPPKGVMLSGPPGCGKTLLANAIAGELNIPLIKLQATEIVSKLSGESEGKIRQVFQDAAQYAPCIIFIDDIDVLAGKSDHDDGSDMKRRIVTQLMQSIDQLNEINAEMAENGGQLTTDLNAEELLARNDMEFNPITGQMEISKSIAEKALDLNNDDNLMMRTAMMNNNKANKTIIVLGATSRLESIDPALRRAGRFDREIALGIPDEFARASILRTLTKKMRLNPDCNIDLIGKQTVGFVGADLVSLTREAAVLSLNRIFNDEEVWTSIKASMGKGIEGVSESEAKEATIGVLMGDEITPIAPTSGNADLLAAMNADRTKPLTKTQEKRRDLEHRNKIAAFLRNCGPLSDEQLAPFDIKHADFTTAAKKVQPTAKREGFAMVPETTWADVGALDLLRAELDMAIVQPIQEPELFESLGLNTPAGVLLFGPPGCGKTLVAKAVANASGASFLSVKGPELLNQYVGESERAVRQVFKRAQMCSPCVIFFDELDALVPKRGGGSGNQASERVVNQLLTELDGFDDRRAVFVIAATNRPDIIDPAVLRPGRLDKLLYLPLPDAEGRLSILMKHTRRTPFDLSPFSGQSDEERRFNMLRPIAFDANTEGFSGADMQALVREATTAALKQYQNHRIELLSQGKMPQLGQKVLVTSEHFKIAFTKVRASVSPQARKEYEQLCQRITQGKGILQKDVHTVADGSQTGGSSR